MQINTALVIGVSGQDGSYLAKLLLEKGYRVIGTSRDHEVNQFCNLNYLGIKEDIILTSMDACDFHSVISVLKRYRPAEVYNLSGQSSVGMSFQYPLETLNSILMGTVNLLECIRLVDISIKFYNAGSSEVFGNTAEPAIETTPFRPVSPYATAKAAATYAVSNYRDCYGMFACTGIMFNHESSLRPERFVTKKIVSSAKRIASGSLEKLTLGRLDISRDWGWAPEYVEAMWRMLSNSEAEDFVIATGESHTLLEFVEKVFSFFDLNWNEFVVAEASLCRPMDPDIIVGNPEKALKNLDWLAETKFDSLINKLVI
jgi:GDPmannose 4,6-dehydratase